MLTGWQLEVPGLLTRREVAEIAVRNGCGPAILADEGMTVLCGERGGLLVTPAVTVGDEALYTAQLVGGAAEL